MLTEREAAGYDFLGEEDGKYYLYRKANPQ